MLNYNYLNSQCLDKMMTLLWWCNHLWETDRRSLNVLWMKWWPSWNTIKWTRRFFLNFLLTFCYPLSHISFIHPTPSCVPSSLSLCCALCPLMDPVSLQNCHLLSLSRPRVCTRVLLRCARLLGATCKRTDQHLCIWLTVYVLLQIDRI